MDGAGSAYVTGSTVPLTSRPHRAPSTELTSTSTDAFVVKLNPAGSGLAYATFLGGNGGDYSKDIAVDGGPRLRDGRHQFQRLSDHARRFRPDIRRRHVRTIWLPLHRRLLVKLNATGSRLTYATFLGGSGDDSGRASPWTRRAGLRDGQH